MIPAGYLAALCAFRPSGRHLRIVLALAQQAWTRPSQTVPRDVVMPAVEIARRVSTVRESIEKDLQALEQRHRLARVVPHPRGARTWRLNTSWQTWGWWSGSDLSQVAALVAAADDGWAWMSPVAQASARILWGHLHARDGTRPCYRQQYDPTFRRWVEDMAKLEARGHGPDSVREALSEVEPWLDALLVGDEASEVLTEYLPALLMRARRKICTNKVC